MDFLGSIGKEILGFGVGMGYTFLSGKLKKNKTKLHNDLIPATSIMEVGLGGGAISGGDLGTTLSGVAGSVAANLAHHLFSKVFTFRVDF